MRTAVRGGVYFALVFAIGFVLGVVRVVFVVPALGERTAEVLEAPLMVLGSLVCARFVVRRYPAQERRAYLWTGAIALSLLLLFEFTVVLAVRGTSLPEYLGSRDPVAGVVYCASLVLFAVMPWLVAGRSAAPDRARGRSGPPRPGR